MKRVLLRRQRGMTLIELLVALALMMLVTLATVGLYSVTNQSYKTVDANQEMQDNARFAFDVIGQALRSAGYQDRTGNKPWGEDLSDAVFGLGSPVVWPVQGANNSGIASGTSSSDFGLDTNANGVNGSDTLVARFFGSSLANGTADGRMVDCSGRAIPYPAGSLDVGVSAFFVAVSNGEPELRCKSHTATGFDVSSLIRGVENFQVMYGLDSNADFIPDRWVSAQNVGASNWGNVVAVKVGMVLRGPVGSAQSQSTTAALNTYFPLGKEFTGSLTEAGLSYAPAFDSRLRKAFSATFLVRNTLR